MTKGGSPYLMEAPADSKMSDTYYIWGNKGSGLSIGVRYDVDYAHDMELDEKTYMPHFMDSDVFSGGNAFMQTFGTPVPLVEAFAMGDEGVEPCNAPSMNPAGHCH
ncbi:hypothetical protein T492DRAFT_873958 [Pavlovales sp. CCMP2436]|nr:hypothetical protein T492DRAFT_873958 [Pavlovales sp. CCMP2436]|mmetsp:Transcript_32893/g.81767  ORF Transcript_32893/g.81767 Transcript_32893/m.81767 type:complete len:106 (+) Transcript_32893:72-389(+)|eukprot:CAMPEP_0179937860 /NCGR_PEP_ID=MMETSP0983-20121128/14583_1 /TAXON_ID=483367 /ORGANISM="non described non described, Strain CCMP 2436" /LENGTH=105 /DNA_ID=CAMNT_0021843673 /DNA_START=60 /DNA_END=377 /DNA_ORIENTATION=-